MTSQNSYAEKSADYFSGERHDLIDRLERDPARTILEIGCGDGATAAYAKRAEKSGHYVGVELSAAAAERASAVDQMIVANIEETKLDFPPQTFDVLIASEVLEHLVDPWAVLRTIHPLMKTGGRVFASSPNIAHKSTLSMLLAGRWDLDDSGRMDRTHLRWFTPSTYAAMFDSCGYQVISVAPLVPPSAWHRLFNFATANRLSHLLVSQIVLEARVRPAT